MGLKLLNPVPGGAGGWSVGFHHLVADVLLGGPAPLVAARALHHRLAGAPHCHYLQ